MARFNISSDSSVDDLISNDSPSKKFNEQKKRKSNYYKEKKNKWSRISSSISCARTSEPCEVQPPIENENRFISSSTESSDHSALSLNVSIDSS